MKKNILIADDDKGILESMSLMLDYMGYNVSTTSDGQSLHSLEVLPDLLLLDIWMSGTDGRDVCRQLKSNGRTRLLPVIMISASRISGNLPWLRVQMILWPSHLKWMTC